MSFSKRCKKELLKREPINAKTELISVFHFIGSLRIKNNNINILFKTFSNTEARYIYNLIKEIYDYSPIFEIRDLENYENDRLFSVLVEDEKVCDHIIKGNDNFFVRGKRNLDEVGLDIIKSYLKLAFIFRGSVNDPQRGYNLEISVNDENEADVIYESMEIFELNPKINQKRDFYTVYLKDSDKISDFLALIGANKALFELENVRAMKSLRNDINRQTNFDKANIDRTVNASLKQVDAIKLLIEKGELENLSQDMIEIANLRLENPYTSIEELGLMMDPPISKSKTNYRLQKFIKLAEDLK